MYHNLDCAIVVCPPTQEHYKILGVVLEYQRNLKQQNGIEDCDEM